MPMSERELFARLLKCEAEGEGVNGMKAVASVIMNRVHVAYGQYLRTGQGSLRRIIEEPYEFTCLLTEVYGQTNPQNVYNMVPDQIQYDIVDWALAGNILSGAVECLWYMNPFNPECPQYFPYNQSGFLFNRIGEHCFYQPTPLYAET
jgi:N-acetylmuramoyl-L-alanine amidase